jgi:hypothetical protein
MTAETLTGYWSSPWPGEDGGPARGEAAQVLGTGPSPGFDLGGGGSLQATSRSLFAATMCVLRDPGEVFLLGHTIGPDSVSWVERIHPESLEPIVRSPDLAGGPFWPGGLAAHADGSVHVTFGRHCHRLDPQSLEVMATARLPRDRPYNSHVVLPSGHLVMKDIGGGVGMNRLPAGVRGSELVALDPVSLDVVARLELPEGSIARLSALGRSIYVVGESRCHRVEFDDTAGTLTLDRDWSPRYRIIEGQTFGWDIVLAGRSGWFLDNGEGSDEFGGSFRGRGHSTAPLHLVRVPLPTGAPSDGARPVELTEVAGQPGGVVANPPAVDPDRHIAVGYDSSHGVMTAWRYDDTEPGLEPIWQRQQDHAGHMLRFARSGQLLSYDYDHERGLDQAVVLDIETGTDLARVDTGSPVQCVLFPSVGWNEDAYVCTFAAVTRLYTD